MSADQTPVDVEAIRAELAAMAGRPWTAEAAEYFIGRLLDENARLNTELAARDRTVEALSARLTAKNAELDKVIREAAADKARIGEPEEEWAIRVVAEPGGTYWYHHEASSKNPEQSLAITLEVLADGRDLAGNPVPHGPVSIVKRTVWSTEWETVEPSEMPRPPAQEARPVEPSIPMRYGPDCEHKPEWQCSAHGECRACECGCFTYPPPPEGTREAAQEPVSGPKTAGTGSGRGTGVAEAPGTAQVDDDV